MDDDRLKHSLAVANKMVKIGKNLGLNDDKLNELFLIGFNHDIGYAFNGINENHNIIGGTILKKNNYKYWKEIYYHGDVEADYKSLYLDILNQADMQIDKYGIDVGYDKRLQDIKCRYGIDSKVYKKCEILIKKISKGI